MIIMKDEQGSEPWKESRLGIPTASNFHLIVDTKGNPSKSRTKYLYNLAGERISGQMSVDSFKTFHTERGNTVEPEARNELSFILGEELETVGLCLADDGSFGMSPDALLRSQKVGFEVKCKSFFYHCEMVDAGKLPTDHFTQVQGGMLVSGYDHWVFFAYFPGAKPLLLKIKRDNDFCNRLQNELVLFNRELDALVKKMSQSA